VKFKHATQTIQSGRYQRDQRADTGCVPASTRIVLGDLAGISNKDASAGLKTALEKGALAAVALLGKTDGFLATTRFASLCRVI
jgi:hypothetical protein